MNYFIGSLYGDYEGYQKIKQNLKLKPNDTLWILGDILDSNVSAPEAGLLILNDIQATPNIKLLLGDHEFAHIMRYISLNDDKAYEAWFSYLQNMDVSGEELVSYLETHEEEGEDEIFSYLINACEISHLIQIGDNFFYITHGFPALFTGNLTEWQLETTTGTIKDIDYISVIKNDPSFPNEIKQKLTPSNCFVICAHQQMQTLQAWNTGIYHKNGIFLLGENQPEEQIPVLAIDAAGYFFKNLLY